MKIFDEQDMWEIDHYLYLVLGILFEELKTGESLCVPGVPELNHKKLREDEIELVKYDIVYLNKILTEKFTNPNVRDMFKEYGIDEEKILKIIERDRANNKSKLEKIYK